MFTFFQSYASSYCIVSEQIFCNCSVSSFSCIGEQRNATDVQEVLQNTSSLFQSSPLKKIVLNISNLEFESHFSLGLHELESLSLGENLEQIDRNLFNGLPSLVNLTVKNNNIEVIENHLFADLTNLKSLNLQFNKLKEITPSSFYNLSNLEFLSLIGNEISVLNGNIIQHLPVIKTLILDWNNIGSLDELESSSLFQLSIQNGNLSGPLQNNSLSGLTGLHVADLSSNRLTKVDSYALSRLHSLQVLNLSRNVIERLEDHAFHTLTDLKKLDLSLNKISVITLNAFANLANLRYLDLSNNSLRGFMCQYTLDLISLEEVYLKNNWIKFIEAGTFHESHSLQELHLEGNIFECTCQLSDFNEFLRNKSLKQHANPTCNSPASQAGISMKDFFDATHCNTVPINRCSEIDTTTDYDYLDTITESTTHTTHSQNKISTITVDSYNITESTTINETSMISNNYTTELSSSTDNITSISTNTDVEDLTSQSQTTRSFSTDADMLNSTLFNETESTSTEVTDETYNTTVTDVTQEASTSVFPLQTEEESPATNATSPTREELPTENVSSTTENVFKGTLSMDNAVKIINYTNTDDDFCVTWSLEGALASKPKCSLGFRGLFGFKPILSKCPENDAAVEHCLDVRKLEFGGLPIKTEDIYMLCIKVRINSTYLNPCMNVSSFPSPSSTRSPEINKIPIPTPLPPRKFNITKFHAMMNSHPPYVNVTWEVNVAEGWAVCNLTLNYESNGFSLVDQTFPCSNNSHLIINIDPSEHFKLCLVGHHVGGKTRPHCAVHKPDDSVTRSSRLSHSTLDDSLYVGAAYSTDNNSSHSGRNSASLIAVVCLLAIVLIVIIFIVMKNILKKRTESDVYNVHTEKQTVQRRTSNCDSSIRCSYIAKETFET